MKTDASSNVREGCFDVRAGKIKEMQYHNTLSLGDTQRSDFLGRLNSAYRFPRVFGDKFGDEFGDEFSDSLILVTNLVTNLVIH